MPPQSVWFLDLFGLKTCVNFSLELTMVYEGTTGAYERTYRRHIKFCKQTHMSNTLDQIPVDKTWSPTESSRKMKPEVQ